MTQSGTKAEKVNAKGAKSRRRHEPLLDVAPAVIPDSAIRSLIDECVVPALVKRFIKEKTSLPAEQTHNGQRP